ncbi:amidohydrolase family protein, partial [Escherichia coli]|nr:amidohydrolase family protein [Escherichia coli]
ASRIALDALESAVRSNGDIPRRHRLEHLETVTPENIERLVRLGVVASMQPVHADPAIQENWRKMLGDHRIERGYPLAEIERAGARVALSTDAPTASHRPFDNLYTA